MIIAEWIGDVAVARVTAERVDASRAPLFKEEIIKLLEGGATRLVLDLSAVRFIDSSGLGAIVSCLKRLGPAGNLAIAGAEGAVARLFALTRMDRVFTMRQTVVAAVAALS